MEEGVRRQEYGRGSDKCEMTWSVAGVGLVQSVSCRVVEARFVFLDGLNLCAQNVIMQCSEVGRLRSPRRAARWTLWCHDFASRWTHLTNVFGLGGKEISLCFFSLFFLVFVQPEGLILPDGKDQIVKTMTEFLFFFLFFFIWRKQK